MRYGVLISLVCLAIVAFPNAALPQYVYPDDRPRFATPQAEPTVYVGYLFKQKGFSFTLDHDDSDDLEFFDLGQRFDLRGIHLEFMMPVKSVGPLGFTWGWSWLFPLKATSTETYRLAPGMDHAERAWNTDVQWWSLQAALTYAVSPTLTTMLGIRYDNFMTNFKDPEDFVQIDSSPGDVADLTVSSFIPYLGVALTNLRPANGPLKIDAGLLGFPVILGSIKYRELFGSQINIGGGNIIGFPAENEFGAGYFIEAYSELTGEIYGVRLGGYAKFNALHATTGINLGADDGNIPRKEMDANFDRRSWSFGGKASVDF